MINIKQELRSYQPIDLKRLTENNPEVPDNVRNSAMLYNKALVSLRTGSEDIAIIELKKVISLNPEFYEALNLLGICYSYIKDFPKAIQMFEKAASVTSDNEQSLNYLNMLGARPISIEAPTNKSKTEFKNNKTKNNKSNKNDKDKKDDKLLPLLKIKKNRQSSVWKYSAIFAVVIVVALLISSPFLIANNASPNPGGDSIAKAAEGNESYEVKYKKLTEEHKKLQQNVQDITKDLDYYKNVNKLFEIEKLVSGKKYEEAADKLILLKDVYFKDFEKEKFNNLYNEAITKAAQAAYNEGNNLMALKKYQEAINKLSKVQVYGSEWSYMDRLLYNMGKCYLELNDTKSAKDVFKRVKEGFPRSQYARYAESKIREIDSR